MWNPRKNIMWKIILITIAIGISWINNALADDFFLLKDLENYPHKLGKPFEDELSVLIVKSSTSKIPGEGAKFVWLKKSYYIVRVNRDGDLISVYEWQPWSETPNVIVPIVINIENGLIKFKSYSEDAFKNGKMFGYKVDKLNDFLKEK